MSTRPTLTGLPVLETERLILRAPRLPDFEAWAAYFASDRSTHEGGPLDRAAAYRIWASDVALWQLRGYGPFAVEDRATGAHLGDAGVYQAAEYPGPELGWFVTPQAEGKGIACEAARAVMGWLRESQGWDDITSIIDPANSRSVALGLRLGGRMDATRPGIDPTDVVIVHDLRGLS